MKKFLAPLIISGLFIVFSLGYVVLYFVIFTHLTNKNLATILMIITALIFGAIITAMIRVTLVRIKELKEEDEDDYRKY